MDLELWKNEGQGRVVIRRLTQAGVERDELLRGGAMVKLSAEEREMNHTASVPHLDPFLDGTLTYLSGGDPDQIPPSPNRLPEWELADLLSCQWKKAEKRIDELQSVGAVERLYQRAIAEDAGEKRIAMVRKRLAQLDPEHTFTNRHQRKTAGKSEIPDPQEVDLYDMTPKGVPINPDRVPAPNMSSAPNGAVLAAKN